ncbi:MAG: acetyl-CoA C-acyltransferase [Flavobacteriales bacterium]|nr:acetyl-CoA C-acyltransferase [Flavobacteriales bacterium]NNK80979.1 acetyl-CoA C-acyltransferase [Flavobacteriales bacterium]
MQEVYIISAVRTPIGSFLGSLSTVPAPKLGSTAINGALAKANVNADQVQEVFMGNVMSAGMGQAPARQAAIFAGIPEDVPCTTVNKVCASGMKALSLAAQTIKCGDNDIVVAGGMENMSLVPHYLNGRNAVKLGDIKAVDGMVKDGLTDVYNKVHMGVCADKCATEHNISRQEQDAFALESYRRAEEAWKAGKFNEEVVPVEVPQRRGEPIVFAEDEEYKALRADKVPTLRPVFTPDGTVTAANASTLNDGASAIVLMSKSKMEELGLKPIAKIIGYGDAAQEPEWFTTSPSKAIPVALKRAGKEISDIDYWELNEAFSVVGLANMKLLGLDPSKVDVNGGAVSIGHPLGNSGSRIIVTLINVLKQNDAKYGGAGICNGGGGASAMIIENC